jgi:hypothetical protein
MLQKLILALSMSLLLTAPLSVFAEQHKTVETRDYRTSLNLSPKMKMRQLETMRQHLMTVQHLIDLIATEQY